MSHPPPNTQDAQYVSAADSDSDSSPNEGHSNIKPRLNLNPSTSAATNTVPGLSPAEDHITILRDLRQREIELTRRTSDIEKLLVSITTAINQLHPGPSTSTPITQPTCHDIPGNPTFTSDQHTFHSATIPTFPLASQSSQFVYPESAVREALDLIPKFDGHNISVLQFARACKRAKELIPFTNESYLIKLLRNKLTNHAYLAVEDETHDTVDKFIDSLKRTFGPSRSSNYYRGQLSVNYKKPNEHILDYISRVKDLRNAILEGDQALYKRSLSSVEITHIDSFTLESFFEGLPAEYRTEIRMEKDDNLNIVYNKAISASKRLERDQARFKDSRSQVAPQIPPQNPPVTILQRPPRASMPVSQAPGPDVSSDFPTKICNYCKRFGHLISECRKRQYNNNVNENQNADTNGQQGNAPGASAASASRGQAVTRPLLPIDLNPRPSTSSDQQQ